MKINATKISGFALLFMFLLTTSCSDTKEKKMENNEEAKVGKVYDTTQQGIRHENIKNQFPSSRNDNKKTAPLTEGKSDTTFNKADTVKVQPKTAKQ